MASEIKVDTVSEKTSANGITIDGLNIKDAKLVTANSVVETNMSANSVDSDSYVDGSIDTAHIADLNVTTGKIAADAITAAKIADNAVVTAGINADAVTGAKIADDAINSEHYTDGSIDTAHIADGQVTVGKLATAVFTGATDIGAAIVDADLFLMDDGAGGTIRKTAASRIKTYAGGLTGVSTGSGNVTITDGNLIVASGHGIDFSATANSGGSMGSELLDDYEEGTWTPTVGGTSTDPTVDFTTQLGYYTKIGNVVKVDARILINTISSGGGNLNSRGLPFTSSANAGRGCGSMLFSLVAVQAGGAVGVTPYVEASSTYVAFAEMNDAIDESLTHLQVNDIANSTVINYSVSYTV